MHTVFIQLGKTLPIQLQVTNQQNPMINIATNRFTFVLASILSLLASPSFINYLVLDSHEDSLKDSVIGRVCSTV